MLTQNRANLLPLFPTIPRHSGAGKFSQEQKMENRDLTFLATEKYREERAISSVSLTSDVVNGMIKECCFEMTRMTVTITSKLSQTEISLSFGKDD